MSPDPDNVNPDPVHEPDDLEDTVADPEVSIAVRLTEVSDRVRERELLSPWSKAASSRSLTT